MTLIVPFRHTDEIEVRLVDNNRPRFGVGSSYPITSLAHISRRNFERLGREGEADSLITTAFGKAVSALQDGQTFIATTPLERLARISVRRALHA